GDLAHRNARYLVEKADIIAAQEVVRVDRFDVQHDLAAVAQDRCAAGDDPAEKADLGERHDQRGGDAAVHAHAAAPSISGVPFMRFSMRIMRKATSPSTMPEAKNRPAVPSMVPMVTV